MFTQYSRLLSASFIGMPLVVTLMRLASVPRMRIAVYPMPLPASLVVTTEGMVASKKGMSRPVLRRLICSCDMLVKAIGVFFVARVATTCTSCS